MEEATLLLSEMELIDCLLRNALKVSPRDVRELVAKLPGLRRRFLEIDSPDFPRLRAQLDFLAGALESFASGLNEEIPMLAAAEAAVAMAALCQPLEGFARPELDSHEQGALVAMVLQRHLGAFKKLAQTKGVRWENLEPFSGEGR
jgi:hypothetical protein